ncbi:MAG TPA: ATP-binding protein [Casimicrobiaceae bacterium]|nr:ATP-binding protein [Casimicrobiaceae bacterium]
MDSATTPPTPDDGPIGWLRVLLATSVLAPALVFVASAWIDYRQTVDLARQRVDRTAAIGQEHAQKVLESSELLLAHLEDVLGGRDAPVLRAEEPSLHEQLARMAAALPHVQGLWVLDEEGRVIVTSRQYPAAGELSRADRDYFRQHRDAGAALLITGTLVARRTGESFYVMSKRREVDGRFAGVTGVSLYPRELNGFFAELAAEQPGVTLLVYRGDGTVIVRYPDVPGPPVLAPDSPWMQLARAGPVGGIDVAQGPDGQRRLVALRQVAPYPIFLAAGIPFTRIEQEWVAKALVPLGFAIAAMLALGAASWMALRTAREEHAATREWQRESARREKAEQALRESQRMEAMGQLTGGVAHDFNNLLMVVNGNMQILRRRLEGMGHDRQLDAIGDAVGRGVRLTRHLLAFSRRSALQPRTLDLLELMPGLCELLGHSLRENIRLECDIEPDTWPVKADPGELELALLNIAVNARDAMPDGGTLTVTARNATVADLLTLSGGMTGEYVLLSLHDTGTGIPPAILSRVFEPFFTTKPAGKGTGLGLSQVYGFTRQSGGTVTLQSPPGRGTTVTLWLPRSSEEAAADDKRRDPVTHRGAGTILLVEDDSAVAEVLRELLEQLGYSVITAHSGLEALERLESGRAVDLLLTDVVMLGALGGLELARTVAARYPRLPVIVMTGYAAEIARIAAEGFTVLTKPFDVAALTAIIERKLERRSETAT